MTAVTRVGNVDELPRQPGTGIARRPDQGGAIGAIGHESSDIAEISEDEFQKRLEMDRIRQDRLKQIMASRLQEDVHYGIPKIKGKPVWGFSKPMLFQAGSRALRTLFRFTPRYMKDPERESTPEYVCVTVTMGLYDGVGRFLGERTAICNSKEKRFKKSGKGQQDPMENEWDDEQELDAPPADAAAPPRKPKGVGAGWIYTDAREVLHVCQAIAEKRAVGLLVQDATGCDAFFATPEEVRRGMAEARVRESQEPWTQEERDAFKAKAAELEIVTRKQVTEFVMKVLGRGDIHTGEDVKRLMNALNDLAVGVEITVEVGPAAPVPPNA